nr:uncharacterized protein LOC105868201 [Microcebus murinus]
MELGKVFYRSEVSSLPGVSGRNILRGIGGESVPRLPSVPTEQSPGLGLEALAPNPACLPAVCLHQSQELQGLLASSSPPEAEDRHPWCKAAADRLTARSREADGKSCDQALTWARREVCFLARRKDGKDRHLRIHRPRSSRSRGSSRERHSWREAAVAIGEGGCEAGIWPPWEVVAEMRVKEMPRALLLPPAFCVQPGRGALCRQRLLTLCFYVRMGTVGIWAE